MKSVFTIAFMFLLAIAVQAQQKPETQKLIVTMAKTDVDILLQALNKWRTLSMYDESLTSDQKVSAYKELGAYEKYLYSVIRVDTIRMDTVKVMPSVVKKKK